MGEGELVFTPVLAGGLERAEALLRKMHHAKREIRMIATTPPPIAPAMIGVLFGAVELAALGLDAVCPPTVADETGAVLEGIGLAAPETQVGVLLTSPQV